MARYTLGEGEVANEKSYLNVPIERRLSEVRRGHEHRLVVCYHGCERITAGFSIYQVCQESGMPSRSIVKRWRKRVPSFQQMIDEAIEDRPAGFVERIAELADRAIDRADGKLGIEDEAMSRGEARAHAVGGNLLATACRLQGWIGNLSLVFEREVFGEEMLNEFHGAEVGDRLEEQLRRLAEVMLPIQDRAHRMMMRSLSAIT